MDKISWFKIDDTLHGHPKARRAGLEAMGLWTLAGSYAMAYKTEGFVPDWFVASWPKGEKIAGHLCANGLWEQAAKGDEMGYQFHDWDDYQPSAVQIEAQRESSRDRQRRARERRKQPATSE